MVRAVSVGATVVPEAHYRSRGPPAHLYHGPLRQRRGANRLASAARVYTRVRRERPRRARSGRRCADECGEERARTCAHACVRVRACMVRVLASVPVRTRAYAGRTGTAACRGLTHSHLRALTHVATIRRGRTRLALACACRCSRSSRGAQSPPSWCTATAGSTRPSAAPTHPRLRLPSQQTLPCSQATTTSRCVLERARASPSWGCRRARSLAAVLAKTSRRLADALSAPLHLSSRA